MRTDLILTLDESWSVRELAGQRVAAVGDTGALLAWGSLVAYPDDVERWQQRALAVDVAADASVTIRATEARTTRTGWPFELVDASVVRAGQPIEERVAAFYKFLEYGAVALLRAPTPSALELARAVVLAVFATGAPAWSPVCLHELLAPARRA